ncbi:DUF4159 domain-containing protein [Paenirhodobacter populi]|uniref:DUF4159 domain-containing protein n=1 Tax=Paenirhodobacter populi TaxID=2306993 RepID=A0A443JGZ0_9RHOB|nr:DUF4159 domain-containing protein [Sinirhodobacter populi]RWR19829.1 DUF4159 domain-containing protein [Sinirhodobacter populi]
MAMLGPIGFTAPWLLLGLLALPVLWFILRAVPPAPIRRRFPGVALLLGLKDDEIQAERTPWWLMALRLLALAAAIIGFAGPVLNPEPVAPGQGPLLIVEDGSWASARDWPRRVERMERALAEAGTAGRPAALLMLTDPPPAPPGFADAASLAQSLPGLTPRAWEPSAPDPAQILPAGNFETLWLSDGLARPGRDALRQAVEARGPLRVWQPALPVTALGPATVRDGQVSLPLTTSAPISTRYDVAAIGPDPSGAERELARATVDLDNDTQGQAVFDLPPELRNRLTRFEIPGIRSAGTVSLTDDAVKRRKVALISGSAAREGLELLVPTHYLRQALAPTADLIEGTLEDALTASPDVIILADVAEIPDADRLADWLDRGGLLIRFAGPRLAMASENNTRQFLPVTLRQGERSVGGAMSWGEPRRLAPFPAGSPFAGLTVPDEVSVTEQVLAEPGPELASRTIAALADGTPLVTRMDFGAGSVVLFHVTANVEWSNLPLSGLFPQMLERLAVSARAETPSAEDLAGQTWVPVKLLDGFGRLETAEASAGVPGERLATEPPGPDLRPGLYVAEDRSVALNALPRDRVLQAAVWPASVPIEGGEAPRQMPLKGALLGAALVALLIDVLASLAVSGRLRGARAAATVVAVLAFGLASQGHAQDTMPEDRAIEAASNVVLAWMPTGDTQVDAVSEAGMRGLSEILTRRTTVEPSDPMRIDLAADDLALYTLIYWPIVADAPVPTPEEYARLNRYLRGGGMIVFDTRDADLSGVGMATDAGRRLQTIAAPLEIPPLAPIPPDHVLTRTFYLLQSFPGRFDGTIWVEAPPPDAEQAEGMPFRNLNDGVTPVVIGGNDWASAWAVNGNGAPMLPIGRGQAGERQREIAARFGVNLVMHVLTGNYKSDQVHVPALLERLGQ